MKKQVPKVPVLLVPYIYCYYFIFKFTQFFQSRTTIGRFLKRIYNIIAIQFCIWEANSLHKLTNQRYYVIKIYGKIRVKSTKQIKALRKRRVLNKSLDFYKLDEISIYKTN